VPTRELLAPAQRAQFTTLPVRSARDLARYDTRSAEDLAAIGRRRRPHDRPGFAVQLASLRFPGRPLQAEETVPPAIAAKLAAQVGVDPAALDAYARERDATRREHLLEVQRVLGFRPFDGRAYREPAAWLLPTASGTDAGVAFVAAVLEELRAPDRRAGPVHRRAAGVGDAPSGPAPGVRPPHRRPHRGPAAGPRRPPGHPAGERAGLPGRPADRPASAPGPPRTGHLPAHGGPPAGRPRRLDR
jgi:hypothetical protein